MKNANDAKPTPAQRAETYKESEQQFENVPESVAARTEGVMDTNPAFAGDPDSAPENGDDLAGDDDDDPAPAPVPEPPEPPIAPEPPAANEVFTETEAEVIEARAGAPVGGTTARPAPDAAAAQEVDPAVRRELDDLGRRRAHKVYDWLGFIGGVFALALGITMLTVGLPATGIEFGANFYTFTYVAIAQTALLIKLGFFGVLVAMGLGLMGTFGPRLLKDDRKGHRHHHRH